MKTSLQRGFVPLQRHTDAPGNFAAISNFNYKNSVAGFTFVELLIVVALMGSVIAFGAVMSLRSIARSSVIEERDLFVSLLLSGARAHAMANVSESAHGIHIDNTAKTYVLFVGDTYDVSDPDNRVTAFINENLSITNSSGDTDIIFDPLSGNVSEGAGTISIAGNGIEQQIVITSVGQINW